MKAPAIALVLGLAGCTPQPVPVAIAPPPAPDCADAVPVPVGLPRVRVPDMLGRYATRVELAREAERARGDCWRDAAQGNAEPAGAAP